MAMVMARSVTVTNTKKETQNQNQIPSPPSPPLSSLPLVLVNGAIHTPRLLILLFYFWNAAIVECGICAYIYIYTVHSDEGKGKCKCKGKDALSNCDCKKTT